MSGEHPRAGARLAACETRCKASSSDRTPATQAAPGSPSPLPMTAAGRTPKDCQSCAVAILHREQHRTGRPRLLRPGCIVGRQPWQRQAAAPASMASQRAVTFIDGRAEDLRRLIKQPARGRMHQLSAAEQERNISCLRGACGSNVQRGMLSVFRKSRQCIDRTACAARHNRQPVREMRPAGSSGVANVRRDTSGIGRHARGHSVPPAATSAVWLRADNGRHTEGSRFDAVPLGPMRRGASCSTTCALVPLKPKELTTRHTAPLAPRPGPRAVA